MAVSKVVLGNQTVMDITDSTVDAGSLLAGKKAYGANGEAVTGTLVVSDRIRWSEAERSVKKNLINLDLNYIKTINTSGIWSGNVYTFNDITFTFNSDSTITINGTASADTKFHLIPVATGWFLDYDTDYTLSGCPANGGRSSYYMRVDSNYQLFEDTGSGVDLNIGSAQSSKVYGLQILIASGYTATNLVFKPMIRLASIEDNTYVPYIPDNVELKVLADTKANKSGDTFTGRVSFKAADNNVQINFRPESANYYSTIQHQTGGDEATIFATKTAATSYIFNNGYDAITNQGNGYYWQQMTPGLQIKENKVAINKLIPNGQSQTYNLDVGGTINASGAITQNGTQVALDLHLDQSVILSTSDDTTVTFTNANIHADSAVEPWASVYGLVASNVVTTEGQCVVTFPKQDTAATITCRIYIK